MSESTFVFRVGDNFEQAYQRLLTFLNETVTAAETKGQQIRAAFAQGGFVIDEAQMQAMAQQMNALTSRLVLQAEQTGIRFREALAEGVNPATTGTLTAELVAPYEAALAEIRVLMAEISATAIEAGASPAAMAGLTRGLMQNVEQTYAPIAARERELTSRAARATGYTPAQIVGSTEPNLARPVVQQSKQAGAELEAQQRALFREQAVATHASLTAQTGNAEALRVNTLAMEQETATRRILARSNTVAAEKQSIGGSFLGGAFGRGYNPGAAFNPADAAGNIAGTIGVLARYGAAGVGIAGIFTALSEIRKQYLDYGSSLANLKDIQNAVGAGQLDLNAAVRAGIPAGEGGAAAVTTATEALARYREEIHSSADENRIATETVRQVGQAMVLTGQDAKASSEQLFDATQGFGLGSGGQQRVLDAVENARKNFGGDRAQVLQAMADSADLASSAGIDPEQLANIYGLIQARTGASSSAVASAFERTVSRSGTGQFQQAMASLGVQDTGNLLSELTQLSEKYQSLGAAEQQHLIAQLGGARQARELLPLLQEGTELLSANDKSYDGAGAAAEQYARQQATLAGQLRQTGGELRDIALQAAQSGALAPLGAAIEVLRPVLGAVDELLHLFNQLPAPIRMAYAGILELALAARVLRNVGLQTTVTSLFGAVPGVRRIAAPRAAATLSAEGALAAPAGLGVAGAEATAATRGGLVGRAEEAGAALVEGGQGASVAMVEGGEGAAAALIRAAETAGVDLDEGAGTLAESSAEAGVNLIEAARAAGVQLEMGAAAANRLIASESAFVAEQSAFAAGPAGYARTVAPEAGAFAAAGAWGRTAISSIGSLLSNPITIAIAGLYAVGEIKSTMDDLKAAAEKGASGLDALDTSHTADDVQTALSQLTAAREEHDRAARSGPFGTRIFGALTATNDGQRQLRAGEDYANAEVARLRVAESAGAMELASQAFGTSGRDVVAGLASMTTSGFSARTQIQAVAAALGVLTQSGATTHRVISQLPGPDRTGLVSNETTIASLVNLGSPEGLLNNETGALKVAGRGLNLDERDLSGSKYNAWQASNFMDPAQLREKIVSLVGDVPPGGIIPDDTIEQVMDTVLNQVNIKDLPQNLQDALRTQLRMNIDALTQAGAPPGGFSAGDLRTVLEGTDKSPGLIKTFAAFRPDPLDITGGVATYRQELNTLRYYAENTKDKDSGAYDELMAEIHDVEDKYVQAQIANLERLRRAATSRAGSSAAATAASRHYLLQEVTTAGDDIPAQIQLIESMTSAEINYFKATLQRQADLANAAQRRKVKLDAEHEKHFSNTFGGAGLSREDRDSLHTTTQRDAQPTPEQQTLDAFLAALGQSDQDKQNQAHVAYLQSQARPGDAVSAARASLNVARFQLSKADYDSQEYWTAVKAVNDGEYQLAQTQAALAEAQVQAQVYPGSQIEAAQAQIKVAQIQLDSVAHGTAEWYTALGQLNQAQVAYANALVQYHATQRLLGIDITDPVATARAQLQTATDQLNSDQAHHAPADVTNADQLKVNQDRAAYQKAAFDQQLSDIQTNYQLGRITYDAYISYLNSQHDYLSHIAHRTRQQQDELNQVDQLLKQAASQMEAQFNLGDIKLPTVYEERRALQAGGLGGLTNNQTVSIYINGADMQRVRSTLAEYLGPDATYRKTTSYRKV